MNQASSDSTDGRTGYLPSLDGWRAIAIMWVMQAHVPAWKFGWLSNSAANVDGGKGVQLFFALSGVLICTRLLREEQRFGAISLRSFYTRRLFRIQPAALAYLGVLAALMAFGAAPQGWAGIAASLAMVRNFFPRNGTWETAHFWSLAAEEHFYLFLPGFLLLCRRYRLAIMIGLVVAFEVWRISVFNRPRLQGFTWFIYFRTDMVIGGILLGCAFALALRYPAVLEAAKSYLRPWLALLYAGGVLGLIARHQSTFNHAMLITIYPVLIVATMLHPASLTTRFLELAPVRFVGRISYGLYLWQMLFLNPYFNHEPHTFHLHPVAGYVAAFACAIASHTLIETPLIRRGHKIAKRFDLQVERQLAASAV